MSWLAAAAVLAVGVSLAARWRTTARSDDPAAEAIVIVGTQILVVLGIVATLLAVLGHFTPVYLALACGVTAAAIHFWAWPWPWFWARPWRRSPPREQRVPKTSPRLRMTAWLVPALIVIGGTVLRMPPNDYALAGRDQGTYTLRAEETARTGRIEATDEVLADAGDDSADRPGRADILGLHPRRTEPWRRGQYEGAYRPGWYLADRDEGRVVPQFLHLHPMLLATAELVLGPRRGVWLVLAEAALALLAVWCVARRLWPAGPWAALAATGIAVHPLAIWVQRTALSEVAAGLVLWAAALCVLRARDRGADPAGEARALVLAAAFLGAVAWLRGNGWLWAPIVLAWAWACPGRERRRRPALVYLALVVGAVVVHAGSAFPYLHDELHRMMVSWLGPLTPTGLVVGAAVAAVAWLSIDELAFHGRIDAARLGRIFRVAPIVLVAFAVAAVTGWLVLRGDVPTRPFSRLDPLPALLRWPLLATAGVGAVLVARRVRLQGAPGVWLLALATIVVATLGLYARRNLPQAGLYYYGRYLVPEILPVAWLLAILVLQRLHARLSNGTGLRRVAAVALPGLGAAGLLWSGAGVLVTDPVSRMREFAGADRLVDALAAQIPADAIVVVGGEGWHAGHTFNQVGGALRARHGLHVVPYQTAEATYATLHHLLVTAPTARGTAPPDVYLLVGEATHHLRREPETGQTRGRLVAAFDDRLWPPLMASEVTLAEMFVDRLTPVTDRVPVRVTRDELRMALVRVTVDPTHAGEVVIPVAASSQYAHVEGGAGIVDDVRCLSRRTPITIGLRDLPEQPGALVVVVAPGSARFNGRIELSIDGERRTVDPPRRPRRERDTLGPFVLPAPPARIALRPPKTIDGSPCDHGGILELRWLAIGAPFSDRASVEAFTLAPEHDLGHTVEPTGWVSGRGLGRWRSGLEGVDEMVGMAMRLHGGDTLAFAPEVLPAAGEGLDVVVTLTGTELTAGAQLVVTADGAEVLRAEPPSHRRGSWQTRPVPWTPTGPVARLAVHLEQADEDDWVLVRDIGLFSRASPIQSTQR